MKTLGRMRRTLALAVFLSFLFCSKARAQAGTHLNFDGVNDYVSCPSVSVSNQSFSITFWAKRNGGLGTYQYLFSQGVSNNGQLAAVLFRLNNVIGFSFWGDDLDAVTPITDANWHYYAFTYDATTKTQSIYLDGSLNAARTASANTTATGTGFIGGLLGATQTFNGNMDEFRVWNSALSASEITRTMNCELQGNEAGLLRNYRFNLGTAGANNAGISSLTDATAGANHGTLTNFALNGASSNWLASSAVTTGNAIPAPPTVTSPVTYGLGATPSALTASGSNLLWYTTATGGSGTSTAPTPATSVAGTTSYWVTSSNGAGCQSGRSKIDVVVAASGTHLNFDGANDFVNCGIRPAFEFTSGTIQAWVRPAASSNNRVIVANRTAATGSQTRWSLHLNQAAGTVGIYNGMAYTQISIGSITPGTWYHLSFVMSPASVAVYVNGASAGTIGAGINTGSTGNPLLLGAADLANAYPNEYWMGDMDEVRIWNRMLPADEIARTKNCELQGNESGLVSYYKFNQGAGAATNTGLTTLSDATANAYSGSLANFSLTGSSSNWLLGSPVSTGISVPSAPSGSAQTFCGATTVGNLVPSPSSTIKWYSIATGGTPLTTGTAVVSPTTLYVAAANANGCESARTPVSITVNTTPAPSVTSPVSYVQGATPTALNASGTSLLWYTAATGGTGSPTAPTPSTTAAGTTGYWVSQTISGCEGPRAQITVNVSAATATHLDLDGSNDYVQISKPVTADFTLEYWLKTTQTGNTGAQWYFGAPIVDAEQAGVTNDFGTSLVGGKLAFGVGNPDITVFSSSDINTGNWMHVAVSWKQATGDMKLYINGVLEGSTTGASTLLRNATPGIRFGTFSYGGNFFNGSLDEVRIWNTVLTAPDIARRMNCELQGNESGLVAYYNFNQGTDGGTNTSVATLYDVTGNSANNGTLYNFALTGATSNWRAGSVVTTGVSIPSAPTASPQTFCGGFMAGDLVPAPGSAIKWYADAATATPLSTNAVFYASGTYYVAAANANGCESNRVPVNITVNTPALASANTSQTVAVGSNTFFAPSCANLIARVNPSGAWPLSGTTSASVWIEGTQPAQYVKRHYEITPAANAATATGRITLYFTQAEFDAFNAVSSMKLPTGPADATGIARLLVEKRSGTSNNSTGLPNSYTGTIVTIDPSDADIVWNGAASRWEVSFDVSGFSGFFVKTSSFVLPVSWINFTAKFDDQKSAQLQWRVQENDVERYEIERSLDGSRFAKIGTVASAGNGTNSYRYTDAAQALTTAYYRIKQTDRSGKVGYSATTKLNGQAAATVTVWPNPAKDKLTVSISNDLLHTKAALQDISGRILQIVFLENNLMQLDLSKYDSGIYLLRFEDGTTRKLVK